MEFNISLKLGKQNKTLPQIIGTGKRNVSYDTSITDALNTIFTDEVSASIFMYHYLPEVAAPINYKLRIMAGLPLEYQEKKGGQWVTIENNKYLDILNKPNQFQTETDFKKYALLNAIIGGELFINKMKPLGFKDISKLYALPFDRVVVMYDKITQDYRDMNIDHYLFNGVSKIMPENMVWRKEVVSFDSPEKRGVSLLRSLLNTGRGLQAIIEAAVKTLAERGAMGLLNPAAGSDVMLQSKEQDALKAAFTTYGITGKKSPVIVADIPLQYTQVGMNIQELQLNETQLRLFRSVCMVVDVPPPLLGDLSGAALNNMKVLEKTLYQNGIKPSMTWFTEVLGSAFEFTRDQRIIANYDNVEALQTDFNTAATAAKTLVDAKIISTAAARSDLGYSEEDAPIPEINEPDQNQ